MHAGEHFLYNSFKNEYKIFAILLLKKMRFQNEHTTQLLMYCYLLPDQNCDQNMILQIQARN
jgi:hypothetical protein